MNILIGKDLGRYHILEQLGEGGMATVYKAYDLRLERNVAVKVIRVDQFAPAVLERVLNRFEREAKALARLTQSNIVHINDYGEQDGIPYLVMDYLPGGTLKEMLKGQPMPWQEAVRLVIPVARALDYAHRQGMIHRDVKPSNILITADGEPMLTDFGIAKIIDDEATVDLTGTSATVGTPEYMAPEQVISKTVDQRADIYSLGVVFYEMVTGRKPFQADTPMAVLFKQASEPLPRPGQFVLGLPEGLEQVLIKALAKKPEDRYQRMGELVVALEGLTGSQMAGAGKKLEVLNNQEEERKEAETTREVQQRLTYHHQRSTKWGGWAVLGALVVLVALGVALGIGLLNMGQKGIGPLANLANRTSTPSMEATSAAIGSTRTRPVDGMEMVYVPRGEFLMGSTSSDKMAGSEEKPQHTVSLDAYWIDKTNVTNLMYAICVSAGACQVPSTSASKMRSSYYGNSLYDNYPVIYVSWTDANAYCAWAGARLPTEAEWEKAARGTDGKIYPWGSGSPSSRLLNYNSNIGDTTAVGSYPSGASPYGAFDMAGNIWEWVNDWYSATYYSQSPASNPQGPAMGQSRVLRGGALNDSGTGVRSALRYWGLPTNSAYNIGFRCARSSP